MLHVVPLDAACCSPLALGTSRLVWGPQMKFPPNKFKWHLCRWNPIRFLSAPASFLAANSAMVSIRSFPGRFEGGFKCTPAQHVDSQQVPWFPGAEFSNTSPDVASQQISPGLQQGFPVRLGLLAPWGYFQSPAPNHSLEQIIDQLWPGNSSLI